VLVRAHHTPGSFEVFVRTPDRDGVFAALVATLDRLGLGVQEARVLSSTDGHALDNFQVQANSTAPEAARIVELLQAALRDPMAVRPSRRATPRHLRHFRMPAQVSFDAVEGAQRTRLAVVGTDRPGLLADVAALLRSHGLRVHDARIATFGERVEDIFLLSDGEDRALDPSALDTIRAALTACLEGDAPDVRNRTTR
jgi:[protein-PII] uridylyltransferase